MQSSSTARFTRIPLAVIVVLAVGLAGGFVALYATENLPGQGGSSSLTALAPVVLPPSGEDSVSPRHIEALLGPGATLDSPRSTIKGAPSYGQREVDNHAIIIGDTGGPWVTPGDASPVESVNITAYPPGTFDY